MLVSNSYDLRLGLQTAGRLPVRSEKFTHTQRVSLSVSLIKILLLNYVQLSSAAKKITSGKRKRKKLGPVVSSLWRRFRSDNREFLLSDARFSLSRQGLVC